MFGLWYKCGPQTRTLFKWRQLESTTNFIFHHYRHNKWKHSGPFSRPICPVLKLFETLMHQTSQASGAPGAVWGWNESRLFFFWFILTIKWCATLDYFCVRIISQNQRWYSVACGGKSVVAYFNASEVWSPVASESFSLLYVHCGALLAWF